MTYTIDDIKRLVPEATEVYEVLDWKEDVIEGVTYSTHHPMLKTILTTRAEVEILRDLLMSLGSSYPDGKLCFCDMRLGNPMMRGHSEQCLRPEPRYTRDR